MITRAILIASHHVPCSRGPASTGCLDLLIDRPFVHHVIEALAGAGVRELDVLATGGADAIESALGSGERWGVAIRHHPVRAASVYDELAGVPGLAAGGTVLLAHADVLVEPRRWTDHRTCGPRLELYDDLEPGAGGAGRRWSGWCRTSGDVLTNLGPVASRETLVSALRAAAGSSSTRIADTLRAGDPRELLAANRRVLAGHVPFLAPRGRCTAAVWQGLDVRVHRTAMLFGPVYIGDRAEVAAGVVLGPDAVVGADCVIDRGAIVRNALIAPDTRVGQLARCEDVVILGARGAWRVGGAPAPQHAGLPARHGASIGAALLDALARAFDLVRIALAASLRLLSAVLVRSSAETAGVAR